MCVAALLSKGCVASPCQGLKNNDNLRRLAMHNNKITDVGAVAIAEALETCRV